MIDNLQELNKLIIDAEADIHDASALLSSAGIHSEVIQRDDIKLLCSQCIKMVKREFRGILKRANRDIIWRSTTNFPTLKCRFYANKDPQSLDRCTQMILQLDIDARVPLGFLEKVLPEITMNVYKGFIEWQHSDRLYSMSRIPR